ncbi:hypothetical protein [Streptosporangium sp. 'caverna']|uniref:hypothetical protein n=1 Tax=Streptosporangium sp. 'caverna' TaxID=2202249 RepID=UPI000D7E5FA6|nr:hypothetical protein [Streptosporangium sp. 'caverna']AWS42555.1 hypothetical protein DKM19_15530 [Streptosporangium sp. 'caverna']
MEFRKKTIGQIADMICGNAPDAEPFFVYRSSYYLTEFFQEIETEYRHDGSTRKFWVSDVLAEILAEPRPGVNALPETFLRVIRRLMDQEDAKDEESRRPGALTLLNAALQREGFEAFYGTDKQCYLRHIATNAVAAPPPSPHRPFSDAELKRREQLLAYLETASEDSLIEEVLLPLFRQLGFHRITAAGHKDKALEYGKDVWMKYVLPTQHVLYFGIQAKRGKLDSSGVSKTGNANIAEIHNQALMMLGHEIFDPEIGKRVLVDHAFIIAGGEITKAARNWLGNALDASKRSQIMFMDREDILNLFVVTNLPLPSSAWPTAKPLPDEPPF